MKKQTTKTTASVKATSTISLPAKKATTKATVNKAPAKATKPANKAVDALVATLAPQKAPTNTQKKQDDVNKAHGPNNNTKVKNFLSDQINNGHVLKNKMTLANLYHMFNVFNNQTLVKASAHMHTCAPSLYYNFGNMYSELVTDAANKKHYQCSQFKGLYEANVVTKPSNTKAIAKLVTKEKELTPILNLWAEVHAVKAFKAKAFFVFISKLGK